MAGWHTVSLRQDLVDGIEELMKRTKRYRSIAEFVAEAVRLRLEQLGKEAS